LQTLFGDACRRTPRASGAECVARDPAEAGVCDLFCAPADRARASPCDLVPSRDRATGAHCGVSPEVRAAFCRRKTHAGHVRPSTSSLPRHRGLDASEGDGFHNARVADPILHLRTRRPARGRRVAGIVTRDLRNPLHGPFCQSLILGSWRTRTKHLLRVRSRNGQSRRHGTAIQSALSAKSSKNSKNE
jgi:hypothetical protein